MVLCQRGASLSLGALHPLSHFTGLLHVLSLVLPSKLLWIKPWIIQHNVLTPCSCGWQCQLQAACACSTAPSDPINNALSTSKLERHPSQIQTDAAKSAEEPSQTMTIANGSTGKAMSVTMQAVQMIGCLLAGLTAGIIFGGAINVNPALRNQVSD